MGDEGRVPIMPEDLEVRLARVEEKIDQLINTIIKGQTVERIIKLEQQMGVLKWVGGALFSILLIFISILAEKVM
jgi:hypothetical protein